MADYYFVMTDGATNGTATGTGGKYSAAEFATIGSDGFADAKTSDWGTKGHATLNEYYYATVTLAITAGAGTGDFILCSNTHALSQSGTITWAGPGQTTTPQAPLSIYSVSVTAVDTYSRGAIEQNTVSTDDFNITGAHISVRGVDTTNNDRTTCSGSGSETYFYDMTLVQESDYFDITEAGHAVTFRDCTIDLQSATSDFKMAASCTFTMTGGKVYDSTGTLDHMFDVVGNAGGVKIIFDGVDLSAMQGKVVQASGGSATGDDHLMVFIINCAMYNGVSIFNEQLASKYHMALVTNSAHDAATREYQYHYESWGGAVDDATNFYRTGSTAFPSGQKVSLACVTTNQVSNDEPFVFDFPTRYVEFSNAASDTAAIYVLSATALDDGDIWAEVTYPDGTNPEIFNNVFSISEPSGGSLRAVASLPTNTEAWANRVAENRYQMNLDTSGDVGADGVPTIRIYCAIPSVTIYFCLTLGLS